MQGRNRGRDAQNALVDTVREGGGQIERVALTYMYNRPKGSSISEMLSPYLPKRERAD